MKNTTTYTVEYRGWGSDGWVWFTALTTESKYKADRRAGAIKREGREVRVVEVQ
jgi:hypothetical protein